MNSMKRQKDKTLKAEFPRSVCAIGDQWRTIRCRHNENVMLNMNDSWTYLH